MPDQDTPKIEFRFTTARDYRVIASNGAWAGITPRGDIRLEFFIEGPQLPNSIVNALNEQGNLGTVLKVDPPQNEIVAIREVQAGVLLTMKEAKALATLLSEKVKIWEEANAANNQ